METHSIAVELRGTAPLIMTSFQGAIDHLVDREIEHIFKKWLRNAKLVSFRFSNPLVDGEGKEAAPDEQQAVTQKTTIDRRQGVEIMGKTKNIADTPIIRQPQQLSVALELSGTADLIQNCFDQKTIEQMLRKHMGLPVEKEAKVPAECIERAIIRNEKEAICLPPAGFKKGILSAAAQVKGLTKTKIRSSVFIEGGSIPITFSQMVPRMDMVRTAGIGKVPDVRFRPAFEDWKARMIILFSDQVPVQTVIDLLQRAGNIGVGEWRPEKDGSYGTYEVTRAITDAKEIAEVRKICRPPIKRLRIPDWAMDVELTEDILKRIAGGDAEAA